MCILENGYIFSDSRIYCNTVESGVTSPLEGIRSPNADIRFSHFMTVNSASDLPRSKYNYEVNGGGGGRGAVRWI